MQVLPDTEGRSRFVWTIDVTPDDFADPIRAMAEQGAHIMRETLEAAPVPKDGWRPHTGAGPRAGLGPAPAGQVVRRWCATPEFAGDQARSAASS
jgi:hypothetical protein